MAHTCDTGGPEGQAEESETQGHSCISIKFEGNLVPISKRKRKTASLPMAEDWRVCVQFPL